jgi:hypothetical protein
MGSWIDAELTATSFAPRLPESEIVFQVTIIDEEVT